MSVKVLSDSDFVVTYWRFVCLYSSVFFCFSTSFFSTCSPTFFTSLPTLPPKNLKTNGGSKEGQNRKGLYQCAFTSLVVALVVAVLTFFLVDFMMGGVSAVSAICASCRL
jgi:hypothetical protein